MLKFGEFTLKSGRKSTVFYECRRINVTGSQLKKLGEYYAESDPMTHNGDDFDVLVRTLLIRGFLLRL